MRDRDKREGGATRATTGRWTAILGGFCSGICRSGEVVTSPVTRAARFTLRHSRPEELD